jgi:hypothetical protein
MRSFIIFVLSCASVLGADSSIRVVTTVKTNADTAGIYTMDVYTRGGHTNLVRRTRTKLGTVGTAQIRIHRFYHDGQLVGDFVATPDSSGFTTEAGSPYSVSFEFWPSKEVRSAVIGTKDGVVLDAFTCTNGVFSPVESSVIQKANAVGADVKQLFDPKHVRQTSPEDFAREAEDLVQKHKDK